MSGFFYCLPRSGLSCNRQLPSPIFDIVIEEINHILNNWDYTSALRFLDKSGKNPHLVEILSAGESKFFTKKLRAELEEIKSSVIEKESLNQWKKKDQAPVHNDFKSSPAGKALDKANDSLESIKQQRNQVLREQDQLRWEHVLAVEQNTPPEKLAPLVKRIMVLSNQLRECWYKIDYHEQHGILPPQPQDPVMEVFENATTAADLVKIRNNYRSYQTKGKKGNRTAIKLAFYEAVLTEAEKRIKLLE